MSKQEKRITVEIDFNMVRTDSLVILNTIAHLQGVTRIKRIK